MVETKSIPSQWRKWTEELTQQLRDLAAGNTPVGVTSVKLGRSEESIRSKAQTEGITHSPSNRAPYGDMS